MGNRLFRFSVLIPWHRHVYTFLRQTETFVKSIETYLLPIVCFLRSLSPVSYVIRLDRFLFVSYKMSMCGAWWRDGGKKKKNQLNWRRMPNAAVKIGDVFCEGYKWFEMGYKSPTHGGTYTTESESSIVRLAMSALLRPYPYSGQFLLYFYHPSIHGPSISNHGFG